MNKWKRVSNILPTEGLVVDTKIDDADGIRSEQKLKRLSNLWFHADGSMYVYYKPTHWK